MTKTIKKHSLLAVVLLVMGVLWGQAQALGGSAQYASDCSDCISICVLSRCGFIPPPECESTALQECPYNECAHVCTE